MEQTRGKLIYNVVLSFLMAYFIVRSLLVFYTYLFHYEDKLYATGEIHLKLNEPVTVEQIKAALPEAFEKVSVEQNQISVTYKAQDYASLQQKKQDLLEILKNKFQESGFELLQTQQIPPEVSKRVFRLELTVHIPIFIMAIFWFGYFFRWYKEIKKTAVARPLKSKR
jgi:preprotein translocase subunit SecF